MKNVIVRKLETLATGLDDEFGIKDEEMVEVSLSISDNHKYLHINCPGFEPIKTTKFMIDENIHKDRSLFGFVTENAIYELSETTPALIDELQSPTAVKTEEPSIPQERIVSERRSRI